MRVAYLMYQLINNIETNHIFIIPKYKHKIRLKNK